MVLVLWEASIRSDTQTNKSPLFFSPPPSSILFLSSRMRACALICVINTRRAIVPHDRRIPTRRDSHLTPCWQGLFNPCKGRFIAARLPRNASWRFSARRNANQRQTLWQLRHPPPKNRNQWWIKSPKQDRGGKVTLCVCSLGCCVLVGADEIVSSLTCWKGKREHLNLGGQLARRDRAPKCCGGERRHTQQSQWGEFEHRKDSASINMPEQKNGGRRQRQEKASALNGSWWKSE